jgi:two-component system response regulator MprA
MPAPSVFLVEDDPDIALAMTDLLTEEGYDVRSATDGLSANALLDGVPRPCVVLLDLNMPIMNGADLLETLARRADSADFRIIVMTASADGARFREHPLVRGHLRKPFSMAQVVSAMRAALQ